MTPKRILGKDLYTALEVAELLGLTLVTVRKYIHNGSIESIKLGGRYYIEPESLAKLLEPMEPSQYNKR